MENTEALLAGRAGSAWDDTAMSATNKRVSGPIHLGSEVKYVCWSLTWTNPSTVVGAFDVEETNDDPAGSPNWYPVPTADKSLPTVNDNAGPGMVRAHVWGKYARLVYTNASGAGVLSAPTAHGKLR